MKDCSESRIRDPGFRGALQLSREYYQRIADPLLKQSFPSLYPRLAAGLVGNGSECFGFDDEFSRDHDWGVDFYIWLQDSDRDHIPELLDWKDNLLKSNPPEYPRNRSQYGAGVSAMTCADFYYGLIGVNECPLTLGEWLRAPEEQFAMAVNGDVFFDEPGEFTKTRDSLLRYYPEDIRLKKIAAKCMALAQTGQYNHKRTAKRGDTVTLRTVLSRFSEDAIALVFLLNKVYRPYYKWAFRAMGALPVLGAEAARLLITLAQAGGFDDECFDIRQRCISGLCELFAQMLKTQGLSDASGDFLAAHGEAVRLGIKDEKLRSLPAQYEL